jgi:hypothetical protein
MTEITFENEKLLIFIIIKLNDTIEKYFDPDEIKQIFSETVHFIKEIEIFGKREFNIEVYINKRSLICNIVQTNFKPFSIGGWTDYFGVYPDNTKTPFLNTDRLSIPVYNMAEWLRRSLSKLAKQESIDIGRYQQVFYYKLTKNNNEHLVLKYVFDNKKNEILLEYPIVISTKKYGDQEIYPRLNSDWEAIYRNNGRIILDDPFDHEKGLSNSSLFLFAFFENKIGNKNVIIS